MEALGKGGRGRVSEPGWPGPAAAAPTGPASVKHSRQPGHLGAFDLLHLTFDLSTWRTARQPEHRQQLEQVQV